MNNPPSQSVHTCGQAVDMICGSLLHLQGYPSAAGIVSEKEAHSQTTII